jgi:hypothetical protein
MAARPADSTDWLAQVRFLVDEAPHEILVEGARFELYEGEKCVARGTVIDASGYQMRVTG